MEREKIALCTYIVMFVRSLNHLRWLCKKHQVFFVFFAQGIPRHLALTNVKRKGAQASAQRPSCWRTQRCACPTWSCLPGFRSAEKEPWCVCSHYSNSLGLMFLICHNHRGIKWRDENDENKTKQKNQSVRRIKDWGKCLQLTLTLWNSWRYQEEGDNMYLAWDFDTLGKEIFERSREFREPNNS